MISLTCPKCSATMEVSQDREFVFCMYCGNKIFLPRNKQDININLHSRTVDDARIAEAQARVRIKEIEAEQENKRRKSFRFSPMLVWLIIVIALHVLPDILPSSIGSDLDALGLFLLLFGWPIALGLEIASITQNRKK